MKTTTALQAAEYEPGFASAVSQICVPLRRAALVVAAAAAVLCARAESTEPSTNRLPATLYGANVGARVGTNASPPLTSPAGTPSSGKIGLSVVFYPAVLLLLAGVAIYLTRSGWPAGLLQKKAPRKLQVSEIRPLGNRQFLVVAEYEATRLLLGVSQGRIDLLCHLGPEAAEGVPFARLMPEEATEKVL